MKVSLINATEDAVDLLIFTKNTRLEMSPAGLDDIRTWEWARKEAVLKDMANTIASSWEFVSFTFMLEGVSRAFTHQLVRTRTASFAQQTMRVLNVKGWQYLVGPTVDEPHHKRRHIYDHTMEVIDRAYNDLIEDGANIEDARGILPTNILTNIVMNINMRNFVSMVRKRSSSRVQGEYRDVLKAMENRVIERFPWMSIFIERTADLAANELNDELNKIEGSKEYRLRLVKLLDIVRKGSEV